MLRVRRCLRLTVAPNFQVIRGGKMTRNRSLACIAGTWVLLAVLPGCVAGAGAEAGDEGAAFATQPMTATGALTTTIDSKEIAIDFTGMKADVTMSHRINTDADPKAVSCRPLVTIAASLPDGTCKLELTFKAGFAGDGLHLATAKFYAKTGVYQDDKLIATTPCAAWVKEPAKGEVIYVNSAGDATMGLTPLAKPYASQAKATIPGVFLQPQGIVKMKYLGRSFDLDVGKLSFKGTAVSTGSNDIECVKAFHDFPAWQLPDVQPKDTAGFGATFGLSSYQGKRVILLMGAGWCESCKEQAKVMDKVATELQTAGRADVQMVAITDPAPPLLSEKCSFPVFKGDWAVHTMTNADGSVYKGHKNDAFAYDYDGRLMGFFQGDGTVYTNLFEDFVRKNVNAAKDGSGGIDCRIEGSKQRSCGPAQLP